MRWFRRSRRDEELAKDIRFYLEAETEENMARGLSPEDARRDAHRKFGNPTLIREEVYRMHRSRFLEALWQDAQYGLRQLRHSPGFTAVAVLTLALGIGANTAIFSVVNSALLRPLPYPDPGRLAWITERFTLSFSPGAALGPDFVEWQKHNQVFEQIEGFTPSQGPSISLSGAAEPVPVRQSTVTPGFFSMLGLRPIAGRSFTAEDGQPGHEGVLLLSEKLWRSHFGASPGVLGQTVRVNNYPYTVVGVMPSPVEYPQSDIWAPVVLASNLFQAGSRPVAMISVIGRLKPGATPAQAESSLSQIAHGIDALYPPRYAESRDRRIQIMPLQDFLVRNVRTLLLILLGVAGFVFLIACANVANLSFARAATRSREFAIRGALGAGRKRLIRQLLTESLILALIGCGLGLLWGMWSVRLLKDLIPANLPGEFTLDARVFAFAVGITILATMIFGLAPALVASRMQVGETLKASGARAGAGRVTHRLRNAMVIAEIALSLVLLIGAGLLARSFVKLSEVHLGFNPDHVLTAQAWRPMTNGLQTPSQAPFFNQVLAGIRAIPGVKDAGAASRTPLSTCAGSDGPVRPQGATADLPSICTTTVSPDYFRTMQVPLMRGRPFDDRDSSGGPLVVMVNQTLAREAFGDADPVGGQIGMYGLGGLAWRTVVGVVADAKNGTLEQQPWPEIFVPYTQAPPLTLSANFVVRTEGDPAALAGLIRKAVRAVDRNQSVSGVQTLSELMQSSTSPQWFRTLLLGLFALLALVLAAIGVFGVMAYSVSQRTHEIGARLALGAQPRDILALVVGQGMALAAIGLAIGIAGAVSLTRSLSGFLYGIQATDAATFAAALLLLGGTALLACYIPARRAARVDPVTALRAE